MDANLDHAERLLAEAGGWDFAENYGIEPKATLFETLLRTKYPQETPGKPSISVNKSGLLMVISGDGLRVHTRFGHKPGKDAGADMRAAVTFGNRQGDPTRALMQVVEEVRDAPRPVVMLTVGNSPMRALDNVHVNMDPSSFTVSGELRFTFDEDRITTVRKFCEEKGIRTPNDLRKILHVDEERRADGLGGVLTTDHGVKQMNRLLGFKGKPSEEEKVIRGKQAKNLMDDARALPSVMDPAWPMANYRVVQAQTETDAQETPDDA